MRIGFAGIAMAVPTVLLLVAAIWKPELIGRRWTLVLALLCAGVAVFFTVDHTRRWEQVNTTLKEHHITVDRFTNLDEAVIVSWNGCTAEFWIDYNHPWPLRPGSGKFISGNCPSDQPSLDQHFGTARQSSNWK